MISPVRRNVATIAVLLSMLIPPERLGFVVGMNSMAVAGSAVAVIMSIVTMGHLTAH